MVRDALEVAPGQQRVHDQAADVGPVLVQQVGGETAVARVEGVVPALEVGGQLQVLLPPRPLRVGHQRDRQLRHALQQRHRGGLPVPFLLRQLGDGDRLVAHALEVGHDPHRRQQEAQVDGDRRLLGDE